jgi:hypothetical protein
LPYFSHRITSTKLYQFFVFTLSHKYSSPPGIGRFATVFILGFDFPAMAAGIILFLGVCQTWKKSVFKRREKMYSPNFSELAAVAIRRLAWAMGANMGQAVDAMVLLLPSRINPEKVCVSCKDTSKCTACIFKAGATPPLKLVDLFK